MTAAGTIDLSFWQGPVDGWHYQFNENAIPHKIQFICRCGELRHTRYAFYLLDIKKKRYEYIGSSRYLSKKVKVKESLVTRPFYRDSKTGVLLQEWVPVSSLKEGM